MIFTEEEAKTKWCPMARVTDCTDDNRKSWPTFNRIGGMPDPINDAHCIASECMLWVGTDNILFPEKQSPSDATEPVYKSAGYCGLTSK